MKKTNRYGDIYWFKPVSDNQYVIEGDLRHWRFGGKEGQQSMDMSDLGFVDPSGGPFVSVGGSIEGRKIVRIGATGNLDGRPEIVFEVE